MVSFPSNRILALDIMRGITIAGMLLVNNPGSWSHIYAPLEHAEWIGLTPTDLIFPFFMFIMGISTYISLKNRGFGYDRAILYKIVRRTTLIYVIGVMIGWFAKFCFYWSSPHPDLTFSEQLWEAIYTFPHLRILGVMPRLAICYGITAIIAITVRHKYIPYIIISLLLSYFCILFLGNGYEYGPDNILSVVDRAILTPAHMYKDNGIDPEGILSTIPSVAHVLIGFMVGKIIFTIKDDESVTNRLRQQMSQLLLIGAIIGMSGWLLSYGCPISKKIWSPTFVMITCGLGASLLGVLIWIIDIKGKKSWTLFFDVFGVNSLFMYVMGGVVGILLSAIHLPFLEGSPSIHGLVYNSCLVPLFGELTGSLMYALFFVGLNWLIGYQLYKHKIYIKL